MPDDRDDLDRLARSSGGKASRLVAGVFTPATVAAALVVLVAFRYSRDGVVALGWVVVALGLLVGVPYLILFHALGSGRADDRQVVRRSQRPRLYAGAAVSVAAGLGVLSVGGAPHELVALVTAMLCGLLVVGATTLWRKVSLHVAVVAGAAAVLTVEYPYWGVLSAAVVPVVGWARWRDGRHSVAQLVGGALIGGLVAGVVYGLAR